MKKLLVTLALAALNFSSASLVFGQTANEVLIRNATVMTGSHGTLGGTDILVRNGKIAKIGKGLSAPANARVIDATHESFVFELTGRPDKIDGFVELMLPLGLVEVSRTGVVAISRGPEGM